MVPQTVSLQYDQAFQFSSDVGEEWMLYLHILSDDVLILGTRKENMPEGVTKLFASNAGRFGSSLEEASRTQERSIDEALRC